MAKLIGQLAEIVAFAHSQTPPIVHRDLKPANVLVEKAANGELRLRIADFGIGAVAATQAIDVSRRGTVSADRVTTAARGACTPLYASPQQQRGEAPDPRDDVFALGVIWYQMLTGDLNAGAPSGMQWMKELHSRDVMADRIQLLAECVESQSDYRIPTARALLTKIQKQGIPSNQTIPSEQHYDDNNRIDMGTIRSEGIVHVFPNVYYGVPGWFFPKRVAEGELTIYESHMELRGENHVFVFKNIRSVFLLDNNMVSVRYGDTSKPLEALFARQGFWHRFYWFGRQNHDLFAYIQQLINK